MNQHECRGSRAATAADNARTATMPDSTGLPPARPTPRRSVLHFARLRELFQRGLAGIARQAGLNAPAVIDAFVREDRDGARRTCCRIVQSGRFRTDRWPDGVAHQSRRQRRSRTGNPHWRHHHRLKETNASIAGVCNPLHDIARPPEDDGRDNPAGLEPLSRGPWAICMTTKGRT